jgi:hypothetical protein
MGGNMKKNLIVVRSPQNNKGSFGYLNKIKKIKKEFYNDEINIIETKLKTQEDFECVLRQHDGKVLLLEPTNFEFPPLLQGRNIESNQVVDAIFSFIPTTTKEYSKILVMGYGKVGKELANRLITQKYCVSVIRSNNTFNDEDMSKFDIIVNCTSGELPGWFYNGTVLDVGGNWKSNKKYVPTNFYGNDITGVYECKPNIISCGSIGTATALMMLEEVL